ncbi:siderophore biosynthesis lipase/esteras-like protein [Zopfia rhizophila CBS 207.26]|uniref:Siderophore biosynthesis lipase/esteras-like protein n=1 Tax=Zopfia rhizophila CBS 207.26 TaxID=1314779 RepID=A0A6A6DUM5_9PEZI|nr:siderophore biosynthesis lipase/esteras-like protein [Zopfia rhizophila CBS 207.26]
MATRGVLHPYTERLVAFEHSSSMPAWANTFPNTLLWIGGLGDGLLTVKYPKAIAKRLPPDWVLAEVLLSSSYKGWGTGSLKRDAKQLAKCVEYFKELRPDRKIVLMGHSTGCQDIMEYLVGEGHAERPGIDGAILQAGVSDRECMVAEVPPDVYNGAVALARKMTDEGNGGNVMPRDEISKLFGGIMTASRFLSLASPDKNGADDYFSSDLEDSQLEATFGKIKKENPMMFLFSGADQHIPAFVDRVALVKRWTEAVKKGGGVVDDMNGGVILDAHHNLNEDSDEVVQNLVQRVMGFLHGVNCEAFTSPTKL